MARNTTIIRSNYLWDESTNIYETSLKLWEELPEELDYDFLFSQRGVMNLAHHVSEVRDSVRRVKANVLNGVDAQWLTPEEVKEVCPIINISDNRSEEHTSELQSRGHLVCRLLLVKKNLYTEN